MIDLSLLSGVTPGTAAAGKLIAVDANRDITNFRNLTATSLTGTLQTAAQPNITSIGSLSSLTTTSLVLGGNTLGATESAYLTGITAGTSAAGKALITAAATNTISFAAGTATTNCLKMGTNQLYFSSGDSCFYIDSQTAQGGLVLQNIYFNYSSSMLKLINTDTLWGICTLNFDLVKNSTPGFRIYSPNQSIVINTNTNSGTATNSLFFSSGGGNVGIGTFSPSRTFHVAGDILSNASFIGSNGNSGDSKLNLLDGTNGTTAVSMRFGNNLSVNNCMTLTWSPSSAGSSSNYLTFNPYGISNALTIDCGNHVAVNTTPNSSYNLYVNGIAAISSYLVVNGSSSFSLGAGGTNIRSYDISSSLWSNLGIGPTSYTLSANFSSAIRANTVYSSSDRRLKTDVTDFNIDIDKYLEFKPVSYKWKNNLNRTCIGLIAQDVLSIASE
jgi:Chaperone of endosialidase